MFQLFRSKSDVTIQGWPWDPTTLVLDEDFTFNDPTRRDAMFSDEFLTITKGLWTIRKGYKWDGCTWVPDGQPDPAKPNMPITWKATLIHDRGYECIEKYGKVFPYNRLQIDNLFRIELEKADFPLSKEYYTGVRKFGKYFVKFAKFKYKYIKPLTG